MVAMTKHFRIFGYDIHIGLLIRKARIEQVYGYTNRTIDGHYILTVDYDGQQMDWIVTELEIIQKRHNLGDIHLFRSGKKGIHAVCTDKLTLREFRKILNETSGDYQYKKVPFKYGKKVWTLRLSEKKGYKPTYSLTLSGKSKRVQSSAHNTLLAKIFKLDIREQHGDKENMLIGAEYAA